MRLLKVDGNDLLLVGGGSLLLAEVSAGVSGTIAQTAPAFSQSAEGSATVSGATAQTGPAFVQSATADVTVTVTLDQTGPVFTQAVEGSSADTSDPANLSATVVGDTVSLSWDASPLVPA